MRTLLLDASTPFSPCLFLIHASRSNRFFYEPFSFSLAGPRSPPPPHLREPPPPRRNGPPLSPNPGYLAPASSSAREPSRYERPASPLPPARYGDNLINDGPPQRRGRDVDVLDQGIDVKRRRLNDDLGPPRRGPSDLPPPPNASLPNKPPFPDTWSSGPDREPPSTYRIPISALVL